MRNFQINCRIIVSANSPEEAREILHAESEYWLKLDHSVLALESDEITEENENV